MRTSWNHLRAGIGQFLSAGNGLLLLLALLVGPGAVFAQLPFSILPSPSNLGQTVTLQVSCCGSGKVVFYDGVQVIGTAKASGGFVKLTTTMLSSGTHSIHAYWDGGGTNAPLTSSIVVHQVKALPETGVPTSQGSNPISSNSTRTAAGDFNGDGKIDLAVLTYNDNSVKILLGNGDGTFRPAVAYKGMGVSPQDLVVGDFDGDGAADVAVLLGANTQDLQSTVIVFLGNGDGTLRSPSGFIPQNNRHLARMVSADFNRDGVPDLAITDSRYSVMLIVLGDGHGGFSFSDTYVMGSIDPARCPPDTFAPGAIAVGDLNGDGIADLAIADQGGSSGCVQVGISTFIGNGSGGFHSAIYTATTDGNRPLDLEIRDFNGDRKGDVLVIACDKLHMHLGTGDGHLQGAQRFGPHMTSCIDGGSFTNLALGDLNGDGILDIMVGDNYDHGLLYLILGKGDGTFQPDTQYDLNNDFLPLLLVLGDFNGDGRYDLAITTSQDIQGGGSDNVRMMLWQPIAADLTISLTPSGRFVQEATGVQYTATVLNAGGLAASQEELFAIVALPVGLKATSVSGANWLCAIQNSGSGVQCERGDALAAGASYSPIVITMTVASDAPALVTTSATVKAQFKLPVGGELNTANNSFSLTTGIAAVARLTLSDSPFSFTTIGQPVTLTAAATPASATGSVTFYSGATILGVAPLVAGRASLTTSLLPVGTNILGAIYSGDYAYVPEPNVTVHRTHTVSALPQDGFQPAIVSTTGSDPVSLAAGDFNGDGKPDLAVANATANNISLSLGNGDGTFQAAVNYAVGTAPKSLVVADFNGDGTPDIATANSGSNDVTVWLGNSDGTLREQREFAVGNQPVSIAAGDFNGDGKADLAIVTAFDNTVTVLLGKGDGTFQAPVVYAAGTGPVAVAIGDFNGDGISDLAIANQGGVRVLTGTGNGAFTAAVSYSVSGTPTSIVAGDLNGDGKPDLAVAGTSGSVSVLLANGDGTFKAAVSYSTGDAAVALTLGDFNGDDRADLAVAINKSALLSGTGHILIFPGNGDGTLQTSTSYYPHPAPRAMLTADFNGDNRSDLAVVYADRTLSVLPGAAPASDLTVSLSHSGNFDQGSTTGALAITVNNISVFSTSSGVAVVDTLSAGLTATAINGSGWNCTLALLRCTRSSVLAGGSSYPPISVAVTVASNSSASVTHSATVSGGGETNTGNNTASDSITVLAATAVALTSSLQPATYPNSVTFTATVTPSAATGIVVFADGLTPLGTQTLANGKASVSASLGAGSHSIIATYSGDTSHAATVSSLTQVVNKAAATVTVPALQAVYDGQPKSVVVTTNPAGLSYTVTYNGSQTAPTAAGTYNLVVTVSDANYAGSKSANFVIAKAPATIVLSGLSNIFDGSAKAVSTRTFPSGLGVTVTYNGNAGAPSAIGSYAVIATVSDTNYSGTQSATLLIGSTNSIGLSSSSNPMVLSQPVTLTATISPVSGPTGMVTFYDGTAILGVRPLSGGVAKLTIRPQDAGARAWKAFYSGNASYGATTSPVLTETVNAQAGFGLQAAATAPAGGIPYASAVGDFNNDGKADLAVVNSVSGDVSILLGKGDGSFLQAVSYDVGNSPLGIAAGDFNGDGNIDLAVANSAGNTVSVLLGNGNGTFQAAVSYGAGNGADGVAVADFNRDGKADLAVINASSGTVSILLGNGNGTFQAKLDFVAGSAPAGLAVADFNGDGKADLAVSNRGVGGGLSVLLGNGDGTFQGKTDIAAGSNPQGVTAGDFNGDGKADVVVASLGDNTVKVLLGKGDGSFQPLVSYTVKTAPAFVVLADFNGDGKADLAVVNEGASSLPISVLLGNGDGTFQAQATYAAGLGAWTLAAGDFNGDGRSDLAVPNPSGVSVLLGMPPASGSLVLFTSSSYTPVLGSSVTLTASVLPGGATGKVTFYDGSSILGTSTLSSGVATLTTRLLPSGNRSLRSVYGGDGVHPAASSSSISVMVRSMGSNAFLPPGSYSMGHAIAVAAADFNGDGKPDLAAAGDSSVGILLGSGSGTFLAPVAYPTGGTAAASLAVGDFNGDGKMDVAVANSGSNNVSVLLGIGNGAFQAAVTYPDTNTPSSVAVGDFNGDGIADLAVANSAGSVSVMLGKGDGTFQAAVHYTTGDTAWAVAVGDFNGDGKTDLVVALDHGKAGILLGKGDGTFQAIVTYLDGGNSSRSVAVADLDGDGIADLVIGNFSSNNVSVFLGNGDGSFRTAVNYAAETSPWSVAIGDFDGDGRPDIFIVGANPSQVSILTGRGNGTFGTPTKATVGVTPRSIALADFNGDGMMDLAAANYDSNSVSVLLGRIALQGGSGSLTIKSSHAADFFQGQSWAIYTIVVSALTDSSGTVTVTDHLPEGITSSGIGAGAGWACDLDSLTCTRSDDLAAGNSYPPITLYVQVAADAPSQVSNTAVVSVGHAGTQFSDLTFIRPACTYGLSAANATLPSGSGTTGAMLTGSFVLTADCIGVGAWTAVSDSPRLIVTGGLSGSGSATISYSMFTNSTTQQRVVHINVAGLIYTITQAGSTETQSQRVVRALYQTILGREPDASGFQFWTGPGAPKDGNGAVLVNQMADGFYRSTEFRTTGWQALSIYRAVLGRSPSYGEWLAATASLHPGGSASQLVNTLTAGAEYRSHAGGLVNNQNFVQQSIQNGWGRPATTAELSTYAAQLNLDVPANAALDFLNNTIFPNVLFQGRTNAEWVEMLYFTILGRDPDPGGFAFWLGGIPSPGIYYVDPASPAAYAAKLGILGQAVTPNPANAGFLGSAEFQSMIQ